MQVSLIRDIQIAGTGSAYIPGLQRKKKKKQCPHTAKKKKKNGALILKPQIIAVPCTENQLRG